MIITAFIKTEYAEELAEVAGTIVGCASYAVIGGCLAVSFGATAFWPITGAVLLGVGLYFVPRGICWGVKKIYRWLKD
jgi:hypothetical protein